MSPFLLRPAHFAVPSMASLYLRPLGAVWMPHVQSTFVQTSLLYRDHFTSHPTPTPLLMTLGKTKALIPGK